MLSIIKSVALNGIQGFIVDVQVDISGGIPCLEIVGLPDMSVREAKERVRTAIKNSGFGFPSRRIVINLAPAAVRKEGAIFDLPMAIAILAANGYINLKDLSSTIFLGELGLDGTVNPVNGILPMCIEAKKLGFKKIIVPYENAKEASIVKELEVIPAKSLNQVALYLNNQTNISPTVCDWDNMNVSSISYSVDFEDVKGQRNIKRALEVAASGGHNCLLIGSPGSGKTMMAKRIPTILPNLSFDEAMEVTKIHSIAGKLNNNVPFLTHRPFISPHHTISKIALVGGGASPKPGDVSLAHYGVLFLDELPEFDKKTIEVLRGPIEDGIITISRFNAITTYPCRFMLVASMNPCPCGFYGSEKECCCSEKIINRYLNKVSGPILDRIDIQVEVSNVKYENFISSNREETSNEIKNRVERARKIQLERYKDEHIYSNSELTPRLMETYCKLDEKCEQILEKYFNRLGLSARAYGRILKVARTIADMDESSNIEEKHLLEAIQYRNLDRKYIGR